MIANDREWETLSSLWRADPPAGGGIAFHEIVASHRRRLAAVVACEILAVAGLAALSWLIVRDGLAAWELVWLTTLWSFMAVALPFAWWNRRGAWNAMTESVAEYWRLRALRRARSVRFGIGLFAAEVIVVVAELTWLGRFTPFAALLLAAFGLLLAAWVAWMRRQAAREASSELRPGDRVEP